MSIKLATVNIVALTSLSAAGASTAVDVGEFFGHGRMLMVFSAPSAGSTWDFVLEHSDDGVTGWSVAAVFPRLSAPVAAGTHAAEIDTDRLRRFVRLAWTVDGSTPAISVSLSLVGTRQTMGLVSFAASQWHIVDTPGPDSEIGIVLDDIPDTGGPTPIAIYADIRDGGDLIASIQLAGMEVDVVYPVPVPVGIDVSVQLWIDTGQSPAARSEPKIVPAASAPSNGIVVAGTPPLGTVSAPYSWAPTVTGGRQPYVFSAVGTLPAGFSLDPETGTVASGGATAAATTSFAIRATDADGYSAALAVQITVRPIPAAMTAGSWTVRGAQGDPFRAIFNFTGLPADTLSMRYQSIAGTATTGWTGNSGVAINPVVGTDYVCSTPVKAALAGTVAKFRVAPVLDWGQTSIPFAGSDIKTCELAPLVSNVTDTASGTTLTIGCATTGASGTIYAAPYGLSLTGTPEEQSRAIKAASQALGAAWRKSVTASGAQTITVTGLQAGQSFAPVHVVHETAAGLIGNVSAGDGFATAGAPVVGLTVTEPAPNPTVLDGGTLPDFLADQDATASYNAAGTAPGVTDGTQVSLALVRGPAAPTIRLLAGLPANPTRKQFNDTIEANAPIWFANPVVTDPRTAAQFAASVAAASMLSAYTLRITGGSGDRHLTIRGVDFGETGIWVDNGWQVTLEDVRCAGLRASNDASIDGCNVQIVGRGDGTELWRDGWTDDAVEADASSDICIDGFLIAGHPRDAVKHAATSRTRLGLVRLRVGHIGAPIQYLAKPQPYDPARLYQPGDVFYPAGRTSGPFIWRVLAPFTDYLALSGRAALPTYASGWTDGILLGQDLHADFVQDIASSERMIMQGVVFNADVTQRLTPIRTVVSTPIGNAVVFSSWPDPRGVKDYADYACIRIRDPQGWIKSVQAVGTTTVTATGTIRPPSRTKLRGIEIADTTQPFDIRGDADVVYRDVTDLAGTPIALPAPAVEDLTLPVATPAEVTAPVAGTHRLSQGSATIAAGVWTKALSVPYSGAMTWAIEAVIASPALKAVSTAVLRTDLSAAPSTFASTVAALPYDRVIFDSGFFIGGAGASIPLSGTTAAPDGTPMWIRGVHYDDDTDTPTGADTGWQSAGVATGGAWSGALILPRVPGTWSRAQVRAGTSSPATGTSRFAAGHDIAYYEQSNGSQMFDDPESVGATITDVQAVQTFDVNRTTGVASRKFIVNGDASIPAGLKAMANTFIAGRPGEKLVIRAHTMAGTSPQDMIAEPQVNPRKWAQELALHTLASACGQKCGLVMNAGWISWFVNAQNVNAALPVFLGRNADGSVVPPGGVSAYGWTLYHDLREFYTYWNGTTGYTRFMFCGPHGRAVLANKATWTEASDGWYEQLVDNWRAVLSNAAVFPEAIPVNYTNDGALRGLDDGAGGWFDTAHMHEIFDWARPQFGRTLMANMMIHSGLITAPVPAFDRAFYAADGSYVDFWMDGRNVTTERNRRGLGTSAYVRGFSINGVPARNTQLQANAGGSGYVGVRVAPATGVLTYQSLVEYGRGELVGFETYPTDYINAYTLDLPMIDVGVPGVPAMPVKTRCTGNLPNTLPAPSYFTINPSVAPNPAIRDTLNTTAGSGLGGQLTMRAKMKFLADLGINIFNITSVNMQVYRAGSGASKGRLMWNLKDSAGATMFSSRANAALYNLPLNQLADIVVSINLPGQVARMWVDGVQIDNVALPANSGQFNTSRYLEFLGDGTIPTAQVELLEVWHAYTATGDTAALGTPRKRITASPAGLPVETPATPAWVRGALA